MSYELLQHRHLKLLDKLKKMGVRASTLNGTDDWEVLLPASRYMGWIKFFTLEPPADEWVILRTKGGSVFEGRRIGNPDTVWDYEDREHRAYCAIDFSDWMTKP